MAIDVQIKGRTKTYRIATDSRQFILSEQKIAGPESKNPGEKKFVEMAYFARLSGVVERIVMLELNDMDIKTLAELKDAVIAMGQRFADIFDWQDDAEWEWVRK